MSEATQTPALAGDAVGTVQRIFRYPVKSMLGEELTTVEVDDTGLIGDHVWALVDVETGKLGNAKNPRKWGHLLKYRAEYVEEPVRGAELPPLRFTFPDGTVVLSSDPLIDDKLSASIGIEVRLMRMDEVESTTSEMIWLDMLGKTTFSAVGSENEHGEHQIDFDLAGPPGRSYDLGHVHLITTASLARARELNPDADFNPLRYRPNFIIETPGEEGFIEASWFEKGLDIGTASTTVMMNAVRCIMTTLSHGDLPVDRGTLRTLVKHNTLHVEPFGLWASFGVYAEVNTRGSVTIGSPARVVQRAAAEVRA